MEREPDAGDAEPDDDAISGMPDGALEAPPLGVADEDDEDAPPQSPQPGIPEEGQPEISS
ncbi:MAG: hypothetical protein QOG15_3090 [Solirubrobacteraceae bacterium]|jgi:hypothetical protein|nr:hypothetical protein [Solirubrobacteraceae bacterium]